jgi:hypothetical protein
MRVLVVLAMVTSPTAVQFETDEQETPSSSLFVPALATGLLTIDHAVPLRTSTRVWNVDPVK